MIRECAYSFRRAVDLVGRLRVPREKTANFCTLRRVALVRASESARLARTSTNAQPRASTSKASSTVKRNVYHGSAERVTIPGGRGVDPVAVTFGA